MRSQPKILVILPALLAALAFSGCSSANHTIPPTTAASCETWQGGIIRGPKDQPRIAIVFTGHGYAEGAETILNELTRHHAHASFFLTGAFLTNRQFTPLVKRMQVEGHYLGPHSDGHLLYCDWDAARRTLVTHEQFQSDLNANIEKLPKPFRKSASNSHLFLPPFEQYNSEIVAWSSEAGFTLINYTPGTRSNADYTGEADANFVSSQAIFDSVAKRERTDPHGLNGFILLLHVGSGPGRTDKFHHRFGELLDYLAGRGYQFVCVDELLQAEPKNIKR